METKGSIPCSQKPVTGARWISSHNHNLFLSANFNIILPTTPRPPQNISPLQVFRPKFSVLFWSLRCVLLTQKRLMRSTRLRTKFHTTFPTNGSFLMTTKPTYKFMQPPYCYSIMKKKLKARGKKLRIFLTTSPYTISRTFIKWR